MPVKVNQLIQLWFGELTMLDKCIVYKELEYDLIGQQAHNSEPIHFK